MRRTDPEVAIRRLAPEDWQLFQEIRLRALKDAPAAFSTTLAEAARLGEAGWRSRLEARAQFVAMKGSEAVGTAGGILTALGPELISMWVDPRLRGAGVGDRLVDAVLEWARSQPFDSVGLWVAAANDAAERLYWRHGFRRTGVTQAMAEGVDDRCEVAMRRPLDRSHAPGG